MIVTSAPAFARLNEICRPMRLAPPVTNADLPLSDWLVIPRLLKELCRSGGRALLRLRLRCVRLSGRFRGVRTLVLRRIARSGVLARRSDLILPGVRVLAVILVD